MIGLITMAVALAAPTLPPLPDAVDRLAFGSCAYSRMPDHHSWDSIGKLKPQALVLLGDNVYADSEDPEVVRRTLQRLGRRPRFRHLRKKVPLFHVWDDHDFGGNDSDGRHSDKEGVRQVTLDFFRAAQDDPRRTQEGGIYTSHTFGEKGQRLQLIVLDTRWDLTPRHPRSDGGRGRYAPGEGKILGEAQWHWLERELAEPAELRIVVSSIPFGPEYTGWETWANFPAEQDRLATLLTDAGPVLVVTGDVHYGEISRFRGLIDFTTSGLAGHAYPPQENANRLEDLAFHGNNFGMVDVDWKARTVVVRLHQRKGPVAFERKFGFDELDP